VQLTAINLYALMTDEARLRSLHPDCQARYISDLVGTTQQVGTAHDAQRRQSSQSETANKSHATSTQSNQTKSKTEGWPLDSTATQVLAQNKPQSDLSLKMSSESASQIVAEGTGGIAFAHQSTVSVKSPRPDLQHKSESTSKRDGRARSLITESEGELEKELATLPVSSFPDRKNLGYSIGASHHQDSGFANPELMSYESERIRHSLDESIRDLKLSQHEENSINERLWAKKEGTMSGEDVRGRDLPVKSRRGTRKGTPGSSSSRPEMLTPSPSPSGVSTSMPAADPIPEQTLAGRLNNYFPTEDNAKSLYSDAEILEISTILKYQNPRWSKVPRTYIVFRTIGHLDVLDHCIDVGFSDYWFPVTERVLPDLLRPSVRAAFVAAQSLILTQSTNLEKGDKGHHCYFRKGETIPFEMKGVLGSGGYGQVDRVLSLISFKEYARKRVLRSTAFRGRRKEDVKQFIAEIEILKRLKHRHVVEFVGSYTDAKYIGLIMSPIADEDLTAYLARASPAGRPELRTFFGCLATALEFLHAHNVRHKDIKPGNILVSNGKVLFADFGLSFDFTDATGSTTMSMVNGMTPRYCAPEVANHEARNTMSDIWCLGVVFLEMIVTLKGENTQYMDDYLRQHGSEQAFVRLNAAALPQLIAHLATLGQWSDNKALEWTEPMLSVTQKSRPTASALAAQITAPIREGDSTGFCGICCVMVEEEDFSDYASGSE